MVGVSFLNWRAQFDRKHYPLGDCTTVFRLGRLSYCSDNTPGLLMISYSVGELRITLPAL